MRNFLVGVQLTAMLALISNLYMQPAKATAQPRWEYAVTHLRDDRWTGITARGWEPVSVGGNQYQMFLLTRRQLP